MKLEFIAEGSSDLNITKFKVLLKIKKMCAQRKTNLLV